MRNLILLLLTLTTTQMVIAGQTPVRLNDMTIESDGGLSAKNLVETSTAWLHIAAKGNNAANQPRSGELVIPGQGGRKVEQKQQCLTVCKNWGEDCVINPRTGARKCRRTCKEFGEECF